MARAKQPVSIGGITFDALIDEDQPFEADAPAYPVEDGFEVSDSIILKQRTLSMTLYLTNTPVTWRGLHGANPARVQEVIERLKDLYFKKEPVTIITNDETFQNMAITSFTLTKSTDMGTSREIPISFRQIEVVNAKTTTIPDSYGKSGETGENVGAANTTQVPAPRAAGANNKPANGPSAPGGISGGGGGSGGSGGGGGSGGSGGSGSSGGSASKGSVLYGLASGSGLLK